MVGTQGRKRPCAEILRTATWIVIDLRGVRQLTFAHADDIAGKVFALFEAGEFDVATIYFSTSLSRFISQIPTALQLITGEDPGGYRR